MDIDAFCSELAKQARLCLPYARGQACKRESMLKESKFGEIMN
jgi:hypothetical protein